MQNPKIVIQYPFITLYRITIFQKLSRSSVYDYTFWAGKAAPDKFLKSAFNDSGLNVEEIPLSTFRIPFVNKLFELQFSALLKLLRTRPDVYIILANPNSLSSWLCMAVARIAGSVVLAWSHGFLSDEKGLKGWVRTLFYRLAHGHLLYGNRAKQIMLDKGFDGDRIDVIFNSLDYATQSRLRDALGYADREKTRISLGIDPDALVLISIGRLMSKLKIDQAIQGVRQLNDMGKKTYLLVIGDGPEKQRLTGLTETLKLAKHVVFYGACHNEQELSTLYNAADISVVMGKVGLSAMHSLAYGIPLITNNTLSQHYPEIEAVIDGKTGWYFNEDDIADLIDKLNHIEPLEYRGKYYRNCTAIIETSYTPEMQAHLIQAAIAKYLH